MSYDPYKELELSPPCNDEEIRKAYLRLALKYHPDRNPGKDTKVEFQKIDLKTTKIHMKPILNGKRGILKQLMIIKNYLKHYLKIIKIGYKIFQPNG